MSKTKLNIRKIVAALGWTALSALVFVILVAAINQNNVQSCKDLKVEIISRGDNYFIDKTEVSHWINNWEGGSVVGKKLASIDLRSLEKKLMLKTWVSNAEAYIDDHAILHISISERQPVARVFTSSGASFYLDTALHILPVTNTVSARVPVFTGFSGSEINISKADSNLLHQIISMSEILLKDEFLMAMIEQVDMNAMRKFELIPKIGNQVIYFGNTNDMVAKFDKLKSFYKNILVKTGWAKYSGIYLDYKNQVVAKIRDREDIVADSIRTLQLMELLSARAEAQATDSLNAIKIERDIAVDSTLLTESVERVDENETDFYIKDSLTPSALPKPTTDKSKIIIKAKPPAPVIQKAKPKIVMPSPSNKIN